MIHYTAMYKKIQLTGQRDFKVIFAESLRQIARLQQDLVGHRREAGLSGALTAFLCSSSSSSHILRRRSVSTVARFSSSSLQHTGSCENVAACVSGDSSSPVLRSSPKNLSSCSSSAAHSASENPITPCPSDLLRAAIVSGTQQCTQLASKSKKMVFKSF